VDLAVRVIALVILAGSGVRTRTRMVLPLFGLAAAAVAGGTGQPGSVWAVTWELLFFALASLVFLRPHWSPIASEALLSTSLLALGGAAFYFFRMQGVPWLERSALTAVIAFGIVLFGVHASWAVSEAGFRRVIGWVWAVVAPPAVGAGTVLLVERHVLHPAVLLGLAAALTVLAWLPLFYLESRRLKRELEEEAKLGLLPAEDVKILALPWKRSREKSYGRPDERREFVRSALMLAVARQQQRRRQGEKARLRQLEVLTFRTRIRRVLEVRASRLSMTADESFD
jgi:hypothetical protein